MSQFVGPSPLQEPYLCDYLRAQPNKFLHFLRGMELAPSGRLGKVGEGAFGHLEVLNPLKALASCRRNEACSHA
jgi:hypothetical protein